VTYPSFTTSTTSGGSMWWVNLHVNVLMASADVNPGHFVLSGVFFAYRGVAVWRPAWVIRTEV